MNNSDNAGIKYIPALPEEIMPESIQALTGRAQPKPA